MTDTTDIAALREAAELIAHGYKQRWGCEANEDTGFVGIGTFDHDGELCPFIEVSVSNWSDDDGDDERLAEFLTLANPVAILALLDLLEAERQRADKAELELIKPLPIGELIQRLEGQTYEKWFSQSDLKGEQVPVSMDALRDAVAEMSGGLQMEWRESIDKGHHPVPFINFNSLYRIVTKFTAPQKPVVLLNSSTVMSRAYVVKQIVAAGCIVQTGATDKEDDHQPSAPAVLHDVLTAVSIGGGRTELIDALTAIKPKFGAPGSRDVDVRAAHLAIDKAIEKLSNL